MWCPAARSTGPRIDGSVSEWQYTSNGMTSGNRPAAAWAYAVSSRLASSSTWKVPAKAVAGSAPERSRGSRASTMLTLSCEPDGRGPASAPVSSARTDGAAPQTT